MPAAVSDMSCVHPSSRSAADCTTEHRYVILVVLSDLVVHLFPFDCSAVHCSGDREEEIYKQTTAQHQKELPVS